ncbi:SMP-30/Gluconolaconase/LRE domain protein [Chthoniobacter flavus Ellin428]|uniref:SMP-30/Gluconolaconase/LRE domain protein n=1 Tax=Chthoniobacter flavus Ellin428 TaxID=497964 RepID=B4D8D2_9BACT|nr:RICIN domain-containing protein [Chthoniobacter flavus]EDY17325.1 SMP-30/Gluconolaconase/LRE domain protein [Chthoniobacter flavus Ellin428]TCO90105.1 sugar lactone lactonase YvrE [Chthoniobacter flavus]
MKTPRHTKARLLRHLTTVLTAGSFISLAHADDWGAYSIAPASAPTMALEAVGAGTTDGTIVSINKPANTPNQKWVITPKGDHLFTIKPSYSSSLVLAIAKGGKNNGAQLVLETESGQPWQLWSLKKEDNGNYSLEPKHAPGMGIDDNGGKQNPGARIDLWAHNPNDPHLQWVIKPLAGSTVKEATAATAEKGYVPPEINPADIKPGEIKKFTFAESKIFPGTTREVTVFVPAQYDGSKPACVYVKTDGYNPKEKEYLERMIATKEMPVTVGVFVRPGEVPAPMKGTLGRRNRDFEYDGVNDNNVRFLVDELLPYVAKEFNLKLSTDSNDRCMSGGSSGGIAAFVAAWNRPDAFSRVYAASGSFVAFRGGHEFPTMVRKFEAKPIRGYFTTATHDMENCAGDWFLLDQEMDKALKFSGYDYQFRIIDGRHVAGYMDHWEEAMAYLWKGWPEHVKAGPSAPRAQDVLVPEETWQPAAQGYKGIRAAASNAKGEIFFVDTAENEIHRIDAEGKVKVFAADAGQANGLTVGVDGKLYTVSEQTGEVMSYDESGKGSMVMKGVHGNSILAMPDGGFYITGEGEKANEHGAVWHVKDGKKTLVDSGLKRATGLTYRPDQWLLTAADGDSKWGYSYQVNADGSLTNKERFFDWFVADWDDDSGTEGLCYAQEGQMFAATRSGVQISADDGPTQVILPVPGDARVTAVCLGGKDLDILYAFAGDKIWKRKVKTHAVGAWSPWTKVNGTKL